MSLIKITHRYDKSRVLYEVTADSVREALERAAASHANLARANLADANIAGADLAGANMVGAYLADAKGLDPRRVNPLLTMCLQPGMQRGFKLVNEHGEGPYNGGIRYVIGGTYTVKGFNPDPNDDCGAGINLATLPWCMREKKDGYRILIAEHTAKDIVAIPWFSDGKYRVRKCKIVGEVEL